jgi:hypothetical protein
LCRNCKHVVSRFVLKVGVAERLMSQLGVVTLGPFQEVRLFLSWQGRPVWLHCLQSTVPHMSLTPKTWIQLAQMPFSIQLFHNNPHQSTPYLPHIKWYKSHSHTIKLVNC